MNAAIVFLLTLNGFYFSQQPVTAPSVRDFYNIVLPVGADPWMMKHDGMYYLTVTTVIDITIYRSPTLSGIGGGEKKVVWTPPTKGPLSKNIWAPELHHLDGKWYIYFAADDGDNANHRMYVLENAERDPFRGEFVLKGKISDSKNDRWAIDGTVLTVKDKRYFIWSGWEGTENVRQILYIAAMSNPWTISGSRVEISRPKWNWELIGTPNINEGPQVLINGDNIHIVYSASGSWTDDYCLGILTAKSGDDLLQASSWMKHDRPAFKSGNGVIGPGHCSFVKSPDGKDDWIVYHTARHRGAAWSRNVRTQKFDWNRDGTPRFSTPAPVNETIPLPGGDPERMRFEAELATLGGRAKVIPVANASKGAEVGSIETAESFVEFNIDVIKPGEYTMIARGRSDTTDVKQRASLQLTVNGIAQPAIQYEYSASDFSIGEITRLSLKSGANTIRFTKGKQIAAIDCIDLLPIR